MKKYVFHFQKPQKYNIHQFQLLHKLFLWGLMLLVRIRLFDILITTLGLIY